MDALAAIAVFSVRAGSRLVRSQFAFLGRFGREGGSEYLLPGEFSCFLSTGVEKITHFKPSYLFRLGQAAVEGGIHQ